MISWTCWNFLTVWNLIERKFQSFLHLLTKRADSFGMKPKYQNPCSPDSLVGGETICRALAISARTLQEYRDRGIIPYLRLSSRCLRYDLNAVRESLRKLTIGGDQ